MSEIALEEGNVDRALLNQPEHSTDTNPDPRRICTNTDHRKLAICSIICGLSCFGMMSLMYSVKARETRKRLQNDNSAEIQEKVKQYSEKAYKWGIGAIVAWVVLILVLPLMVVFFSYIVTFIN